MTEDQKATAEGLAEILTETLEGAFKEAAKGLEAVRDAYSTEADKRVVSECIGYLLVIAQELSAQHKAKGKE